MGEAGGVARIFLKDGSYKAVRVSGSTTVREACEMFARRLQLPLLSAAYELRQITPQGDRALDQEERVWDVLQEFTAHPDYDPLELQEEKVKYRLLFSFTEEMRTRLSVRIGLPPPRPGKPAPALGVSFLTPSNPLVPVSPFSVPSAVTPRSPAPLSPITPLSPRSSPTLASPPMSPPMSPTSGSMTMRRPPPPVPDRNSKGPSRRQTVSSDERPTIPPYQPQSPVPFQLQPPTFQEPPPQPPALAQPQQPQPSSPHSRPQPQPPARQNRPLPQPLPRGQPPAGSAHAPAAVPAPAPAPAVAATPTPAAAAVSPHAAPSSAFAAASRGRAPPPPAPAHTEAERDKEVDELANVFFKIEGLDQFASDTSAIFDLDDLLASLAKANNLA